jgi:hypothetical protein
VLAQRILLREIPVIVIPQAAQLAVSVLRVGSIPFATGATFGRSGCE